MSPTERTLKELRRLGFACQVVEHWNPHARRRVDLFGFIDVIACTPDGILGIQATSGSNHSVRVRKIREECTENAQAWLEAGGRIEVWSWKLAQAKRKDGSKGLRKTATLRREIVANVLPTGGPNDADH